jgi:hypothetical protein
VDILLGLVAVAGCVLVVYLLTRSKTPAQPPAPCISLFYARVSPSPEELHRLFVGEVVTAGVLPGAKGFALTYALGRTVHIRLVECPAHGCEDTFLIAEEQRP